MSEQVCAIMMSKRRFIAIAAAFCVLLLIPQLASAAERKLTIHIYPYAPAGKIVKQFTPLSHYLMDKLKRDVDIVISKDHIQHLLMIGSDKADIAFLGPALYVQLVRSYGKKPLLARIEVNGSPLLQGVIFISASSLVNSVTALKGRGFAFGYPDSTMSHLVPLHMLRRKGVQLEDLGQHAFLHDQQNVVLSVLMGDFDAGAVNAEIFLQNKDRGLKDIAWSPKVSEHLLVASTKLFKKTVTALRRALYDIHNDPDAKIILSSIRKGMTGFVPVADTDYDSLRELIESKTRVRSTP